MMVAVGMDHSGNILSVDAMTGGWAIEWPMFYLLDT